MAQVPGEDDPVVALYSIITRSGRILRGAKNVKVEHVETLMRALESLGYELHQVYNEALQEEIKARTGETYTVGAHSR